MTFPRYNIFCLIVVEFLKRQYDTIFIVMMLTNNNKYPLTYINICIKPKKSFTTSLERVFFSVK